MKKFTALLLSAMLVFTVVGCTPSDDVTDDPSQNVEEGPKWAVEEDLSGLEPITLGLITDTGGIDDRSFNQGTWEGILNYAHNANLSEDSYRYIQSTADADYIPNLTNFAEAEMDLIVAPGFKFTEAMSDVAASYPEQKFLLIDAVVDAPNVTNAVFAEHEGSFLVGVAAALKAKDAGKDTVGFLGGEDFDLIRKFEAGFEQGVKAIDPAMKVLIEYAGDFGNAGIGSTLASKMYDSGAYVIYHAAGGTGNGLFKEAKNRITNGEDVWAIGVDKDQYNEGIYDGDKSVVLTSMVKRVDIAAYDVAKTVANGEFPGGVLVFSLENNGVSIPDNNPNLKEEWIEEINSYKDKIVSGEIAVSVDPERIK